MATALVLASAPAASQEVGPPTLPGRDPRLPGLTQPSTATPPTLQTPAPAGVAPVPSATGPSPRIRVREIRVTGSTVFSAQDFEVLTAPFVGRDVTAEDLSALRQALTLKYVQAGYINSGALLPDQTVADGLIEYRIVEGALQDIQVTGTAHLDPDYVRDRLALGAAAPLNVNTLQETLQRLLQGPFIERVNAELAPGDRPGEARLIARVQEGPRSRVTASLDNDLSPSLGALRAGLRGQWLNPRGRGDILGWDLAYAQGYAKGSVSYSMPLDARDTTLDVFADLSRASVVESPLNALDIQSRAQTLGVRVTRPVFRDARTQFVLSLGLDVRHSQSSLLGTGFAFSPGVEPDGESRVRVLRFVQDYTTRASNQVTALRSTISWGLGILGATELGNGQPGGKFLSWLGQAQHARRLGTTDSQLVLRFDAQLTNKPLLPLEQFAVGGLRTVRGFRTNQLVRDYGYAASAELRVPVLRSQDGGAVLQLVPFVDVGGAWTKGVSRLDRPRWPAPASACGTTPRRACMPSCTGPRPSAVAIS
ncbi:MAG: ShlB/FhaC/HecB family hemolysin secretion/activation protein [Rhodoferax sp.]